MNPSSSDFTEALAGLKAQQRAWADRAGVVLDKDGYCTNENDNFFRGLSNAARADFTAGDGAELGKDGERGKIRAVHSSSALACNVFDYWRNGYMGGDVLVTPPTNGVWAPQATRRQVPNGAARQGGESGRRSCLARWCDLCRRIQVLRAVLALHRQDHPQAEVLRGRNRAVD
jgi:hypothetical protein